METIAIIDKTNEDEIEKLNRAEFDKINECLGQEFSEAQFTIFNSAMDYHNKTGENRNVQFLVGDPVIKFYREKTGKIIVDRKGVSGDILKNLKEIGIDTK